MQFDSFTFLLFFVVVVGCYRLIPGWSHKKNWLLFTSYVFYAGWNPWFLPLLISTSFADWFMAQKMAQAGSRRKRKLWLWSILSINLGVLGYFKYAYFLSDSAAQFASALGLSWQVDPFDIILPIGISFYTFHSLSYCLDVYRGKFAPVKNLRDYLLYVGFFPQLVAGPIVRWREMQEQIEQPRHMSLATTGMGLCLVTVGLFEKIVLADAAFAPVADAYFNQATEPGTQQAWLGALAFSGQIFCDFAGYTTCALGAALVMGFRLPINFLNPYCALGFSDFWRRWHISLSTWLRDYLYIGLGGNRGGPWLTSRNLMLTMLIGGLWHGAAWTFVIWGGLHGALLILERVAKHVFGTVSPGFVLRCVLRLLTLGTIVITWVWFRSQSLAGAWQSTLAMLDVSQLLHNPVPLTGAQWIALGCIGALITGQWLMRDRTMVDVIAKTPAPVTGITMGLLIALIVLSPGESHAFIYFQF
ncbi:MBOAT family protein [Gilvimarinus sp. SDUM040013]|uniref:Probable alginate O-acetylase n=1 Tax=Gilvimarinus gilvus TaxID=3058038 RepID=A0ABU4RWJ1_9GAMM|nr:MBOAT family protein [Gilvimarinus sp. SDUM040013]MDO3385255.1 MBOAT family protein [Gilvimarinus sp. SDUM040013]MDX6849238.1 MBOAT family protein [Gilvimarinus sp. SDUM040013]